ncbi:MAG: GGDEF domain-containing protein [Actinomycetota bacterium]
MRLVRLAALFGSLMLLTATVVLLVERRGDVRADQTARANAAADAALVSADAIVRAATADVVDALDSLASPSGTAGDAAADRSIEQAASRLGNLTAGSAACIADLFESSCSGNDLRALDLAGALLAEADAGDVVLGVDASTDSVIVVGRGKRPSADDPEPASAILSVPFVDLLSMTARTQADRAGAEVAVLVLDTPAIDGRTELGVIDGRRIVSETLAGPFTMGALALTSAVDGDVGTFGGSPSFFALLIGLGSVLLVLAGGTFLADRRNLEEQATTDQLTGLVNRREFERVAAEAVELADRFGTGLTVMVIDLDGFKQINDTLGHQYGDLVLKGVADRLVSAVRDTDVIGRWGGDEFVALLPGLDETTAIRSSADRITTSLTSSPVVHDTVVRASIGAAAFPRHGADLDSLIRTADAAMYAAKSTGVSHRVADAELARRASGLDEDTELPPPGETDAAVVTSDYVGPDRRHSTQTDVVPSDAD